MSRYSWKTNRFRPRNRPARKVGPLIPVRDDLAGMLAALMEEKASIQGIRLEAQAFERSERDLFLVRLSGDSLGRIREDMVGWTAYGPLSGVTTRFTAPPSYEEDEDENEEWWRAEVATVDVDHRMLVLEIKPPHAPPRSGTFFMIEPDYQELVRRWADAKINAECLDPGPPYRSLPEGHLGFQNASGCSPDDLARLLQSPHLRPAMRPPQLDAALGACSPLSLIWGPPGTGKTFTIGAMVAALSILGTKVLVLAPTNVAIDQACLAIDDARSRMGCPLSRGELIRAGRPQLQALEERDHLMAWSHVLASHSEEVQRVRKAIALLERRLTGQQGPARDETNLDLAELRQILIAQERNRARLLWDLAQNATVIATTLTSGLAHESIRAALSEQRYALVIDEASMVPRYVLPPFLEHPPIHLTLAGDFRQLGPIRRNKNDENANCVHWIGHSAFETAGLCDEADIQRLEDAGILHMLEHQSRMNEGLCGPVSDVYYEGRLVTVGQPPEPPALPEWPAASCLVVDPATTSLPDFADRRVLLERVKQENRWEKSAWIAIGIARQLLEASPEKSVLLLSPFRNQADLLRKLARTHLSEFPNVRAGTVHTSQGNEADLVVFDPVNPRHGWLLESFGKGDAPRLYCVAFSRPRQQLVLMARRAELNDNREMKQLARDGVDWTPWKPKAPHAISARGRRQATPARVLPPDPYDPLAIALRGEP